MTDDEAAPRRVAVWDLPVRIVHWSLVPLVAFSWWTGEEEMLDWHFRSGLAILGLVVFRLVWGVIGSSTARFSSFVRGPRTLVDYLRGRREFVLGHSPLGALSVLALLAMLTVQVGLGLFATDEDFLSPGPLSGFVSDEAAERARDLHELSFEVLKWLIALHVAAILFYLLVRRRNLVGPMVSGRALAPANAEPLRPAGPMRFAIAAGLATAVVYAIASLG